MSLNNSSLTVMTCSTSTNADKIIIDKEKSEESMAELMTCADTLDNSASGVNMNSKTQKIIETVGSFFNGDEI